MKTRKLAESRQFIERAMDHQKMWMELQPQDRDAREDLCLGYSLRGLILDKSGRPQDAVESYRQAIEALSELVTEFPDTVKYQVRLAEAQRNLAATLKKSGQLPQAEQSARSTVATLEELVHQFPEDPTFGSDLAVAFLRLGTILLESHPD